MPFAPAGGGQIDVGSKITQNIGARELFNAPENIGNTVQASSWSEMGLGTKKAVYFGQMFEFDPGYAYGTPHATGTSIYVWTPDVTATVKLNGDDCNYAYKSPFWANIDFSGTRQMTLDRLSIKLTKASIDILRMWGKITDQEYNDLQGIVPAATKTVQEKVTGTVEDIASGVGSVVKTGAIISGGLLLIVGIGAAIWFYPQLKAVMASRGG